MASNQDSDKISIIENRVKPTKLPNEILLNIGVYTRLFYERLRARNLMKKYKSIIFIIVALILLYIAKGQI